MKRCTSQFTHLRPAVPNNIPYGSIGAVFTGREATLQDLRGSSVRARVAGIDPAVQPSVTVVYGIGGVGKTRVAVEYAHRCAADHSAKLFVQASSPETLDESMASLSGLLILNLEEQDEERVDVRLAAVIRWLRAHPGYLLIVDGVDTNQTHERTVQLLSRLPPGDILITSRLHTWPGGFNRLPLATLSDADGRDLLLKYRSSPKSPSPEADATDALALAKDLDGLALAIEQAAAYLNAIAITISEYHERWKGNAAHVLEWYDSGQMTYPASVATTWLTSFRQLAPPSQSLLNLMSWLAPDPIPRPLLRALDPVEKNGRASGADPYKALGELIHFSLVKTTNDGGAITVHRVLQEVARSRQVSSRVAQPPRSLVAALDWINTELPERAEDVSAWPISVPLVPHAVTVATSGADFDIAEPTVRLFSTSGLVLRHKGDFESAERLYRSALTLVERGEGSGSSNHSVVIHNLATVVHRRGRFKDAEELMRRALSMDQTRFGDNHPLVAKRLENLATLLADTNRLGEAENLLLQAIAICETAHGEVHPETAHMIGNLATVLADAGTNRLREAQALCHRALAIEEATLGEDHPRVANRLSNLAEILKLERRFSEAEPLLDRALKIVEASYNGDHPDIGTVLNNVGDLLVKTGRFAEAEHIVRRALALTEKYYGPEHPRVAVRLDNLAVVFLRTNRCSDAEGLLRRALAIDEAMYETHHPKIAHDLSNLAVALSELGRTEEAEQLLRRALAISVATLDENHERVHTVLTNLKILFVGSGRPEAAEPFARQQMEIFLKWTASNLRQHSLLVDSMEEYGNLLTEMGVSKPEALGKIRNIAKSFGILF